MKKLSPAHVLHAALQLLLLGAAIYLLYSFWVGTAARQVPYSTFIEQLRQGKIVSVQIGSTEIRGLLKAENGRQEIVAAIRPPEVQDPDLLPLLREKRVEVVGQLDTDGWWRALFVSAFPILLLIGFWLWTFRRFAGQGAEALQFGRNRAKIYDRSEEQKVTFADVAGVDEAEAELVEIVDFLKHPQKYQRLGGRIPKGVLLVGPPGTGKTLLARAVAGEAGVPFFSISGSEFVELFVGVGAARVRDLFEQAKKHAPCIVFIDELDAIGKSRAGIAAASFGGHDEREQTLNQLLVEMDGFDSSKGVIIMAATNRPEVLDPALLRPGRFDRQIVVDRPDIKGREEILRVHARRVKLAPDVDLSVVAARTPGMVGADLANIINEAALLAARRGAEAVEMRDLEEAIDRVMLGLEKRSRVMSAEEKERVAYHEVGHALTALSVEHADPVHRITIIPRSIGALGATLQLPTTERYLLTKPELLDRLAVMLGGRAAEEIVYDGVISTGAHNDLERATELARQMVMRYGMSERLGHMTFGKPLTGRFLDSTLSFGEERNFSERTAELIDDEVKQLIDATYERVKEILRRRRAALDLVARELQKRETIGREELERLVHEAEAGKPAEAAATVH
ncbi:ATP-dependent zinc metalloprotease FtsH [Pyrinomonas methylaliphatogenes]|uniref:ATP-dependent zinc metalloprotease FtsH n=1 Tax=Pyrinomonas methylaliphatogenes TaxID=454194 RepID=A0A0B6X209_9BACT|nr:ATP-dependent zinc metalloprotease FtsH [Pyrinomonas methylaliphatogenes]MBX5478386.1 ATP-dependent zinc metalloprotease FtsH [Pyrinomonas methylaliphatogenes]CDM66415.1 membrane protease FtsH catalytic subunit [Pyrinomonas methylaliphatogenes]